MFTDIGWKIKNLARIICWIGIILSIIFAIINITSGADLLDRGHEQEGSALKTSGFALLIIGPLCSWIGCFMLYGFGELIDRVVSIDERLEGIIAANAQAAQNKSEDCVEQHSTEEKITLKESNPPKSDPEEKRPIYDPDWIPDEDKEFVRCPQCNKRMCLDFIKARKKCPDCGREFHYTAT